MMAAAANVPSPGSLPWEWYVHPGVPQDVHFQTASNGFQATGTEISKKDSFNYENGPPDAIPKGIYLHSADHALNRAGEKVRCLDRRYPIRLEENGHRKESPAQTKEGYWNKKHARLDTATAETNIHIEPPDGRQKIARVENVHKCFACLPINECPDIDARRSLTHFERTQKPHARVHQNEHPVASERKYLSEKSVAYFKPSGHQTQPALMPMTTSNPVYLTFKGIQSNANQLEPRYPTEIQNLRLPHTLGKPKHHPHPSMWPNPAPVPFPDPIPSFSEVSTNLMRDNREPDANSAKRKPFNVVVSNAIHGQPTLPLSNSVMPSAHYSSAESDYYRARQITTNLSSTSTSRALQASISPGSVYSPIPTASPYYPQDINPLSRGENKKDPTSTKCHVCYELGKQATPALTDHIMNAVPTDVHLASHPPACQLPIYTPGEASENRSQKTHFTVHDVYVPPAASRANAPRPCHAANPNVQSCSADVYNTWDVRQPVSAYTSQSFKTNKKVQYTADYAPSQFSASEGLIKIPFQYSCQSTTFEGICRPTGKETSAPNHRIDSMNSVYQKTPPCSKSFATIVALPRHQDYVAQTVCPPVSTHGLVTPNLSYRSMNGHVPAESNNIPRSANSAFQEQRKSRDGPYSSINSCIAPIKQQHNENSADNLKYGSPSSCSNVSRYAPPNITRGYPVILPQHPRLCNSLATMKEPHFNSVESKPQGDRKKEEFKFFEAGTRCREMVQPNEDRMPGVDQEQRAKKLETFTKFVVGVETTINQDKIKNKSENSNRSKEQDMQIVSVSSTHSPRDDPTETHSSSSQSESDDAFNMMRLERVYYSISAKPSLHAQSHSAISQQQGSELGEFGVDAQKRKLTNLRGETQRIIVNGEYCSRQPSSVAFRNKTSESVKVPNNKRKANISSTKGDEGLQSAKRKKISPKGTVTPALEKVKKSVETLSTRELAVQLDSGCKASLEDLKKTSEEIGFRPRQTLRRIIHGRICKRFFGKVLINS